MNERSHCPSSSALDRLVQCSASHNMGVLAQQMAQGKEPFSGEDAAFGLNVHAALEEGTARHLDTDEERLAYSVMRNREDKFIKAWATPGMPSEEIREHRMWLRNGIAPTFTGRADRILIQGNRALVLDYKSLWNKVPEPNDNHQLKSLAVMLWLEKKQLKEVTIQIVSSHYDYTAHTLDTDQLQNYLNFLERIIQSVNQASQPVAGDWCKHCRGLLICPAVRKKASDLVKAGENGDWPSRLPNGVAGAKILNELSTLESLIKKVKDHYKGVLTENPKAVPGWSLQTMTTKKFKDTRHVFDMLADKLDAGVFDLISISVPKALEKLNAIEQAALEKYLEKTVSAPFLRRKDNGNKEV